jgi:predicted glycosyltransferase involved in capsule biosynthesis
MQGKINRFIPLLNIPLSLGRKAFPHRWQGAKTCNLAMWRQDFLAVNGFDESFVGWGFEDSDLVIRLMRNHILCKSGKFGLSVMHLWHPEASRNQELKNKALLKETFASNHIKAKCGVEKYIN